MVKVIELLENSSSSFGTHQDTLFTNRLKGKRVLLCGKCGTFYITDQFDVFKKYWCQCCEYQGLRVSVEV